MKAFPNPNNTQQAGMDLRDWFAGQVLPKLIGTAPINLAAQSAYRWADEMMKARSNEDNKQV